MTKRILMFAAILVGFNTAIAGTVSNRTVEAVGCYNDNNNCFAILSGANFGPAACKDTQVRWVSTSSNGKPVLATFMLAHSANKKVSVAFSDTQCAGQFPKLSWAFSYN